MKKLDKLLIKAFVGPFVLTFFVSLFVLLMQFLWKYIDDLVGKGLETHYIVELIFYASAGLVPMALPIAILLSSIMTFGNLGEHYELVSMKSAGIPLMRIMAPLIVVAFFLSFVAFGFSNYLLPKANLKYGRLMYDISNKKPSLNIKPGIFYNGIDGYSIRVAEKSEDGKILSDVMIYDHSKGHGNTNVITASHAEMFIDDLTNNLLFKLHNGQQYEELQSRVNVGRKYEQIRTSFKYYEKVFDLSGFDIKKTDENLFRKNYQMLTVSQLGHMIDSLNEQQAMRSYNFKKNLNPYISYTKDSLDLKKPTIKNELREVTSPLYEDISKDRKSLSSLIDSLSKIKQRKIQDKAKEKNLKKIAENKAEKEAEENPKKTKIGERSDKVELTEKELKLNEEEIRVNGELSYLRYLRDSLNYINRNLPDSLSSTAIIDMFPEAAQLKIYSRGLRIARNVKSYTNIERKELVVRSSRVNKYSMEWHRKFVLSVACIVLFFVGAPLGSITRKGGLGLPMVLAIAFFLTYHVISTFGKKVTEEFVLTPFQGIWLSTAIFIPIGIFLTYKAINDSEMVNSNSYVAKILYALNSIRKLFGA